MTSSTTKARKARVEVFAKPGLFKTKYYWRLIGINGKILCRSEAYTRPSDAERGARSLITAASNAIVTYESAIENEQQPS